MDYSERDDLCKIKYRVCEHVSLDGYNRHKVCICAITYRENVYVSAKFIRFRLVKGILDADIYYFHCLLQDVYKLRNRGVYLIMAAEI